MSDGNDCKHAAVNYPNPRAQSGSADSVHRLAGHFHEQQYIAICAIVKDQPLDISFWLHYHFHMGVSKFYLYDNNSTPPMSNVLQDEIDDGIVQYNWFDAWATQPHQNAQMYVYDRCIQKHKLKHKWIAFIDVDEFFVLHNLKHRQFQDLLPAYEQYGGLAANWVMMGSSGLKERPSDPNPFNSYEMCSPMDGPAEYHVKLIVNTDNVAHVISPHSFGFAPGSPPPVTEDGEPIFRHFSEAHHAKLISLYHFVLKSREDYAGKPLDICLSSGTFVLKVFCLAGKVARSNSPSKLLSAAATWVRQQQAGAAAVPIYLAQQQPMHCNSYNLLAAIRSASSLSSRTAFSSAVRRASFSHKRASFSRLSSSFSRQRRANASQYLVKTGMGCNGISVVKRTMHKPFQTVAVVEMNPCNYLLKLPCMSQELVPFLLPVVFTIAPKEPHPTDAEVEALVPHDAAEVDKAMHRKRIRQEAFDGFQTYIKKISGLTHKELHDIIEGIIQGETRVLSARLTIREIFDDRESFRKQVTDKVQRDMDKLGLRILNANIAEMQDLDDANRYFFSLKQKALEGANAEARIEVADARKRGDIGEAKRKGDARMNMAQIEADVMKAANLRAQDMENSKALLAVATAEAQRKRQVAEIEAKNAAEQRQVDLETVLNKRRAQQRVEELRAKDVSIASVRAEAMVKEAEGRAEAVQRGADAELYKALKERDPKRAVAEGESIRALAEGEAAAKKLQADADLYVRMKEAEGARALVQAQAAGLQAIMQACGGHTDLAKFWIAVDRGLFVDLADKMAKAVQNLQPKLNIWTTGTADGTSADAMGPLRNLLQGMPPMLEALQQQTNVQMPSWLPQAIPRSVEADPSSQG
eukprot:jgi/Astpho2/8705/Aster-05272